MTPSTDEQALLDDLTRADIERLVRAARAARHAILYHDSIGTRYEAEAALARALEPFAAVPDEVGT